MDKNARREKQRKQAFAAFGLAGVAILWANWSWGHGKDLTDTLILLWLVMPAAVTASLVGITLTLLGKPDARLYLLALATACIGWMNLTHWKWYFSPSTIRYVTLAYAVTAAGTSVYFFAFGEGD